MSVRHGLDYGFVVLKPLDDGVKHWKRVVLLVLSAVVLFLKTGPIGAEEAIEQSRGAQIYWQLTVKPGAYSGVAFVGEKTEYELRLKNLTDQDREVEIRFDTVTDQQERWNNIWKLKVVGKESHSQKVTLPTDVIGYRAIRIQILEDGNPVILTQEISPGESATKDYFESGLIVVSTPPSYGKRDPECYFGLIFMEDFEATERLGVKNIMAYPS